jgi:hypothetical protein
MSIVSDLNRHASSVRSVCYSNASIQNWPIIDSYLLGHRQCGKNRKCFFGSRAKKTVTTSKKPRPPQSSSNADDWEVTSVENLCTSIIELGATGVLLPGNEETTCLSILYPTYTRLPKAWLAFFRRFRVQTWIVTLLVPIKAFDIPNPRYSNHLIHSWTPQSSLLTPTMYQHSFSRWFAKARPYPFGVMIVKEFRCISQTSLQHIFDDI